MKAPVQGDAGGDDLAANIPRNPHPTDQPFHYSRLPDFPEDMTVMET